MDQQTEAALDRRWGAAWWIAALATVGLMAFHPVARGGATADVVAALLAIATRDRLVHGALLVTLLISTLGWWRLLERLGPAASMLRVARLALIVSGAGYVVAALVNGFIVPALAERYAESIGAELEPVRHLLRLTWATNQVATKLAVFATGLALVGSGIGLRRCAMPTPPALAWSALLLGGVMVAAIASGRMQMHLHVMLAVVVLQAAWNVAAALQLQRGRFGSSN